MLVSNSGTSSVVGVLPIASFVYQEQEHALAAYREKVPGPVLLKKHGSQEKGKWMTRERVRVAVSCEMLLSFAVITPGNRTSELTL